MIQKFFPSWYVKSIFEIDFDKLFSLGFKGLVFDIDNTLVHHGDDSNATIDKFLKQLKKKGFKIIFLSDNSKERVERFNRNLKFPFICEANKPSSESFINAVDILKTGKESTVVIGDQIFYDILGANNAGLKSIFVKFIKLPSEKCIGLRRYVEKLLMFFCTRSTEFKNMPDIKIGSEKTVHRTKKLFCQQNIVFYKISVLKEKLKRHIKNVFSLQKIAKTKSQEKLLYLISSYNSKLIKKGKGIDITTQQNKAVNINLASQKINGILIKPGEVFSFWHTVGKVSSRKGYKKGRVLINNHLVAGTGGGLCNLAHTINQVVLHSELDVKELHFHSDCLAPEKEHVVFSSGTSVDYNYIDYRVKNNTSHLFQFVLWCDSEKLYAELRSDAPAEFDYDLIEEDRHFVKEDEKYYCRSMIYRRYLKKNTKKVLKKELLRKNRSEVMYDYSEIPSGLIKVDKV
ncbi:MAG: HAD-IIIA family hydrolase [Treponema sp.]|uniref:HAD-IIIA family hydrolase n=1 Tax=Treponema sp. TaxID=166 RepID=UPI00298E9EE2|nr:HAD-IIIA family hydrolase [Treponema sp.]MBR5934373.1 HAD-IIIA family hydrolase [Treponema sp.]